MLPYFKILYNLFCHSRPSLCLAYTDPYPLNENIKAYLTKDGETVEEAKARLKKENR